METSAAASLPAPAAEMGPLEAAGAGARCAQPLTQQASTRAMVIVHAAWLRIVIGILLGNNNCVSGLKLDVLLGMFTLKRFLVVERNAPRLIVDIPEHINVLAVGELR